MTSIGRIEDKLRASRPRIEHQVTGLPLPSIELNFRMLSVCATCYAMENLSEKPLDQHKRLIEKHPSENLNVLIVGRLKMYKTVSTTFLLTLKSSYYGIYQSNTKC